MEIYDALASWWPLLSHPDEYLEEATLYIDMIREAGGPAIREVLELGAGGGNNASHMKRAFALTLVEPSAGMRAHSEALNPECVHVASDMRTARLGRTFDAVFVHDAVMYMLSEADLGAALATVAAHLRPGGVALVAPDEIAESYQAGTDSGGNDGADGRALRFLEWNVGPIAGTTTQETYYLIALREADGSARSVLDRHVTGLFPLATWLRLFDQAGMDAHLVQRQLDGAEWPAFVARRR